MEARSLALRFTRFTIRFSWISLAMASEIVANSEICLFLSVVFQRFLMKLTYFRICYSSLHKRCILVLYTVLQYLFE